eukprot:TRINITY_DN7942_c3_g1_i2.p1 TRINITY_DN7942_c3_g1~~TRINITY_DN7942_c3_g1_i2.p1  ORF type:complete len:958 (+),score=359.10 TRINITY_DN7942_c3_g1_i2:619-3492(+)
MGGHPVHSPRPPAHSRQRHLYRQWARESERKELAAREDAAIAARLTRDRLARSRERQLRAEEEPKQRLKVTSWPADSTQPQLLRDLEDLMRKASAAEEASRDVPADGDLDDDGPPPVVKTELPIYLEALGLLADRFPIYSRILDSIAQFFSGFGERVSEWYEARGPGRLRVERDRIERRLEAKYQDRVARAERGVESLLKSLAEQRDWKQRQKEGMAADVAGQHREVARLREAAAQEGDLLRTARSRTLELSDQMNFLQNEVRGLIQKDRDAAKLGTQNRSLAEENLTLEMRIDSMVILHRTKSALLDDAFRRQKRVAQTKGVLCGALRGKVRSLKQQIGELRDRLRAATGHGKQRVPDRLLGRGLTFHGADVGDEGSPSVQTRALEVPSPGHCGISAATEDLRSSGSPSPVLSASPRTPIRLQAVEQVHAPLRLEAPPGLEAVVRLPPDSDAEHSWSTLCGAALVEHARLKTAVDEAAALKTAMSALDMRLVTRVAQEAIVPPAMLRTLGDSPDVPAFLRTPLSEVTNLCMSLGEAVATSWTALDAFPALNLAAALGIGDDTDDTVNLGAAGGKERELGVWDPSIPLGKLVQLFLRDQFPEDEPEDLAERGWSLYWACQNYAEDEPACKLLAMSITGRLPVVLSECLRAVPYAFTEMLPKQKLTKKVMFATLDAALGKHRPAADLLRARQAALQSGALLGNTVNMPVLLGEQQLTQQQLQRGLKKKRVNKPAAEESELASPKSAGSPELDVVAQVACPVGPRVGTSVFVRFLQELCLESLVSYYDAAAEGVRRTQQHSRRSPSLLICRCEDIMDELATITYPPRTKGPGGAAAFIGVRAARAHRVAQRQPKGMSCAFDAQRFVKDTLRLIECVDGEYHTARPCAQGDIWVGADDFIDALRTVPMSGFADPLLRRHFHPPGTSDSSLAGHLAALSSHTRQSPRPSPRQSPRAASTSR